MSLPSSIKKPSNWWWVGHLFFGIITGLVVYVTWKEENPKMAKKHLIHSIWIGLIVCFLPVIFILVMYSPFLFTR